VNEGESRISSGSDESGLCDKRRERKEKMKDEQDYSTIWSSLLRE
jgi:hypothetical protein